MAVPFERTRPLLFAALLTTGLVASVCTRGNDGAFDQLEADPSAGDGDSEPDDDASPGSDDDEGDDDDNDDDNNEDSEPKFDIGDHQDPDVPDDEGCDMVDFLFVIDNSGSMGDEQENLIRSFGGFMDGLREKLPDNDFNVMAVDSDALGGGGNMSCTNGVCTCTPAPECCENPCANGNNISCNGISCDDFVLEQCDRVLGAGKRYNAVTGEECPIESGQRYMRSNQNDLSGTFACLANVGVMGDGVELPMAAMMAATSPAFTDEDGCNDGFVREDALLVVTIISDEDDAPDDEGNPKSPGDPADWKQALVDLKGGDESMIVVVGLIGDRDLPNPLCEEMNDTTGDGAEASPRLREFVTSFGDNSIADSVCAEDYAPYFLSAIDVIATACWEVE